MLKIIGDNKGAASSMFDNEDQDDDDDDCDNNDNDDDGDVYGDDDLVF